MAKAKKSGVVSRKVQRKQALFLKHEPNSDINFQEEPSCHVFVANGGLQNGVSRELLLYLLGKSLVILDSDTIDIKELYLPAGKDYAFATFDSPTAASEAVTHLNGVCIQERCKSGPAILLGLLNPNLLSGPPLHLYLCFVDKIPQACIQPLGSAGASCSSSCCVDLPPGLELIEEFVSLEEEKELLDFFSLSLHGSDATQSREATQSRDATYSRNATQISTATRNGTATQSRDVTYKNDSTTAQAPKELNNKSENEFRAPENHLKHRSVKHYGFEFLYSSSNVDPDSPLPSGLPSICEPLLRRMIERKVIDEEPDQLTVNYYLPGAGIPPHVDTHSAFKGSIISLSLGYHVVMDFRHPDGRKVPVFLQRRSLLIMAGEARYLWTHGIAARQFDEVHCGMPGYNESASLLGKSCQPQAACLSSQSSQSGQLSQSSQSKPEGQSRAATSTILPRGTRTSLTFRKVRRKPCICDCNYPSLCDSQQV